MPCIEQHSCNKSRVQPSETVIVAFIVVITESLATQLSD